MTTPAAAGPGDRSAAFFGTAAMLCFVSVVVVLLVLHALRPDYGPAHHMISDYAVGPYGWLMQSAFVGMSVGCAMLAVALARHGPATGTARLAVALLSVASVGLLASAIFVVIRTALEDAFLRRELPGYADYTRRVKQRLVPGLW